MAQLQAWDYLQMTLKLAKQLKDWAVQSFALQGNYTACFPPFQTGVMPQSIMPQAPRSSIAIAAEQV